MDSSRCCSKCDLNKDLAAFPKDQIIPGRKNQKKTFICKDCKNKIYKDQYYTYKRTNRVYFTNLEIERARRYKEEAIRILGGCCLDCKNVFPTQVYDFHHLDPSTKESSPARMFQSSWDKIEIEVVAKCILLCANCHRIRHIKENECRSKEVQLKNSQQQGEIWMEPQKAETK